LRRAGDLAAEGAGPGWCRGAAGVALARGALDTDTPAPEAPAGGPAPERPAGAVRPLTDRPLLGDLSLCHGELGVAEALRGIVPGGDAARRHLGRVLDAVDRYGPSCGTPGGVPTPGLLTGLAGIGYELLRLSGVAAVPSVLLLEPTPQPPPPG
ncbi:lanthionine synthetase LanC family protein, partial [Micromonospora sp. CPCC 205561]|uniref:lanthionine synthetase LanC family protein n=1 Tax=Micromonospora sp. CPCC 205561 TaxID=3122407 RepID=UPI002FF3C80D